MTSPPFLPGSAVLIVATLLSALFPSAPVKAQSVSGRVTERSTRASVENASIVLVDKNGRPRGVTRSDSAGRYAITAPGAGTYSLTVNGPGLTGLQTPTIDLVVNRASTLDVVLSLATSKLPTVVVEGEKSVVNASTANPHKYDEFLMRRKLGMGTFLTREQIEAKPLAHTPSIFAQIPGLKVTQSGTTWSIRSQRCPPVIGGNEPGQKAMLEDRPELWPILFIDGFHVRGLAALNDINPSEIEAIEVYQGAAQLPAIARGNACAAIFVWLKS